MYKKKHSFYSTDRFFCSHISQIAGSADSGPLVHPGAKNRLNPAFLQVHDGVSLVSGEPDNLFEITARKNADRQSVSEFTSKPVF